MSEKPFLALLLAACTVGCHAAGPTSPIPDAGPDASDSGADTLQFPATNATWTVTEDVSFAGQGASDIGAIAITHGLGTLDFDGESARAFFFNATGVPVGTADGGTVDGGAFAADRDYEIIAVQPTRLIVVFITCTNDSLDYVYYETTDGIASPKELAASGTCTVLEDRTTEAVTLPAVDMPPPMLLAGYSISGTDISYDGVSAGSAQLAGDSWQLYPFHLVDCSACANPGWYELHSLFWNAAKQSACLGILYLEENAPAKVLLAYTVCLPGLTNPLVGNQLDYSATWSAP